MITQLSNNWLANNWPARHAIFAQLRVIALQHQQIHTTFRSSLVKLYYVFSFRGLPYKKDILHTYRNEQKSETKWNKVSDRASVIRIAWHSSLFLSFVFLMLTLSAIKLLSLLTFFLQISQFKINAKGYFLSFFFKPDIFELMTYSIKGRKKSSEKNKHVQFWWHFILFKRRLLRSQDTRVKWIYYSTCKMYS